MKDKEVKRRIRKVYRFADGGWHSLDMRLKELESGPENCPKLDHLEECYRSAMTNQAEINAEITRVLALHDNSLDDHANELSIRLKMHNARTLRLSSTLTALMRYLGVQYDSETSTCVPVKQTETPTN